MGSIRARLTAAYAAAFIGMLVIFSIALLAVRRELLFRELEARVQSEADQVVRAINLARNTGTDPIVAQNDPLAGPSVSFRMQSFLALLDGYVLVQDSSTYDIYASPAVQRLSTSDRDVFSTAAREATPSRTIRRVAMRADTVLLATRVVPLSENARYRVYAALSTLDISDTPRELVGIMLVIAPFLLAMSMTFAYIIAGRAFQPIDRIIDQVEAITDGRSLHRRLAIGAAGDELARLSSTLNAMIERLETSFGALRRFTADASHELKTPLAVMRADIERSLSPTSTPTEQAIAIEEALQQVTRMADLVDSLLTLAATHARGCGDGAPARRGRRSHHRRPVDGECGGAR